MFAPWTTPPARSPFWDAASKLAALAPARSWLLLGLGLAALGTVGCGTTQIFTDDPGARIWANGQLVGRGHAEIQKTGLPETTSIRVEAEDGRQETTTVRRSVTGLTVVGALFTYGTCLIFCWQYPETVWAALPPGPAGAPRSGTVIPRDPWLDPDPGWRAPAPPSAPATIPDLTAPAFQSSLVPPRRAGPGPQD